MEDGAKVCRIARLQNISVVEVNGIAAHRGTFVTFVFLCFQGTATTSTV